MRILFLTRLYHPHVGGIEKHIAELSKVLTKRGHKVTLITTKFEKSLKDKEKIENVNVIRFNQPKIKYLGLLYTWFWLIKNIHLFKESDIVHIHDVFIWLWPVKMLFPNKKVYITYHGQWGDYPMSFADLIQKKIGRMFSDGVISIGNYIDKNYGIKSDIISYGATNNVIKLQSNKVKRTNGILYVGRLDKNVPILNNLERFKKGQIIFCGDGELKDECAKYGQVLGFVDPKSYYSKSQYVFASGYLTILEALAYKCLVFTAYSNSLQKDYYQSTPFKDLIVITKNAAELMARFNYFVSHKEEAKKLIEKGYNYAKGQTWEKLTRDYLNLWDLKNSSHSK